MEPRDYIKSLITFYNTCTRSKLSKVYTLDNGSKVCLSAGKVAYAVMQYNLGFKIGKCSWITQKLAVKNVNILQNYLRDAYSTFMIDLNRDNKYLRLKMVDKFGNVLSYHKIKYLTINWFISKK